MNTTTLYRLCGGTLTKERLLALEGVHADVGTPLLPGFA
jgi:hypothetical protein